MLENARTQSFPGGQGKYGRVMTYKNYNFTVITIIYNCKNGVHNLFHLPSIHKWDKLCAYYKNNEKWMWIQLYCFLVNVT